ncbi:hypothetical protein IEQ34_018328 [Dendrobium chrysotoxum]|uniref:Uncharacterized protein n=1 Tax=Dendrobium chrysotoxum TaxID=161865 RepID=A0AAV7FWM3_DENCH|nr:hypothetical protein IEQ34_018328 [Dendrobium chrysotoxum]
MKKPSKDFRNGRDPSLQKEPLVIFGLKGSPLRGIKEAHLNGALMRIVNGKGNIFLTATVSGEGFDATKERIDSSHNRYLVVPFGGKTTRFRGPRVITVYPAVPFGGETAG